MFPTSLLLNTCQNSYPSDFSSTTTPPLPLLQTLKTPPLPVPVPQQPQMATYWSCMRRKTAVVWICVWWSLACSGNGVLWGSNLSSWFRGDELLRCLFFFCWILSHRFLDLAFESEWFCGVNGVWGMFGV